MPDAHAKFSPSASERWMTCAASYPLNRDAPRTSSIYAAEGTAAHYLASRALEYRKPAAFWIGEQIEADGRVFIVDETMAGYVQDYVDHVFSHEGYGDTLMVEQTVGFSEAIGVPEQFGTSDAIILKRDLKRVVVGDLKYGMGVRVEAKGNRQLLTYAVAVLETFDVLMSEVEEVTVFICQPRLDHYDEHTYPIAEVRAHAQALAESAKLCKLAEQHHDAAGEIPEGLFRPETDACRWCAAKATCPALERLVAEEVFEDLTALENAEDTLVKGPPRVPAGERLGKTFALLDLIEDFCRGLRAEVERQVMAGMTVIGIDGQPMKVIEGRKGHRTWKDPDQAEGLLVGLLPPEKAYKPREIISPAAAEKALGGKKKAKEQWWKDTFGPLIATPPGKPKVVMGSDPAPPYQPAAGDEEFSNLEETGE